MIRRPLDRWIAEGWRKAPQSLALRRAELDGLHPWRRPDVETADVMAALEAALARVQADLDDHPALAPLSGYGDFVTAELLRRQRRHDQAATYYERAQGAGRDVAYLRQQGINDFSHGRPRAALESFARALNLSPDTPELLDWRARSRAAVGQPQAALADWQAALALDPMNPRLLINQARVLHALGRVAEADANLEQALHYGAEAAWVRRARGRYYLAERRPTEGRPGGPAAGHRAGTTQWRRLVHVRQGAVRCSPLRGGRRGAGDVPCPLPQRCQLRQRSARLGRPGPAGHTRP